MGTGTDTVTLGHGIITGDIELGGTIDGKNSIQQTVFKVKVTDADGAVGENKYIVNWHTPFENWEMIDEYPFPTIGIPIALTYTKAGSSAQLSYNYDQSKVDFDFGSALGAGSAFTGGLAVIVAPSPPGAFGASEILGLASAIMGGASVIICTPNPPPDPILVNQMYTSYDKYKDAVEAAEATISDPNAQKDPKNLYEIPGVDGTERVTLVEAAYLSCNSTTDGDGDTNYEHYTYVTGTAIAEPTRRIWQGDHYDEHGFAGTVIGHSDHPDGAPTMHITWLYNTGGI